MSVEYRCDHCGELVGKPGDLAATTLVANPSWADEEHPKRVIWEGDLCNSCRWKLNVMRDKACAKVYERFAVNLYGDDDWAIDEAPEWVARETEGVEALMERYAEVAATPQVEEYHKLSDMLYDARWKHGFRTKAEREFYKESNGHEFTLELPYDELMCTYDKAHVRHHSWSYIYTEPGGKTFDACLSLCGYTREQVEARIDERIAKMEEKA